jgi:hypothetical protein
MTFEECGTAEGEILTSKEVQHRLEITPMMLYYWRFPEKYQEATGIEASWIPLPSLLERKGRERHTLLFPVNEVTEWLRMHRPLLVQKLKTDECQCDHCVLQRFKRAKKGKK